MKGIPVTLVTLATTCALFAFSSPMLAANLTNADQMFMKEAAQSGIAEVDMGRLAERQAQEASVKDFGRRMVTDHTMVNDQLMTLAKNKGVTLPKETDAQHKAMEKKLNRMKGTEFDKAYMQMMVTDHQKDVNAFEKTSKTSKDADLKRFAANNLPTLKEHLKMAQELVKKIGTKSKK